jgi:hypothetical protein
MNHRVDVIYSAGDKLYAGGWFTNAAGNPANHIAKWNGTTWSAIGTGMNSPVQALAIYNGQLYAGGSFTQASNAPISYIAKADTFIINSVIDQAFNTHFNIYPNPCKTTATIAVSPYRDDLSIKVFNLYGQQLRTIKLETSKTGFNRNELSDGLYLFVLYQGNKAIATSEIILSSK